MFFNDTEKTFIFIDDRNKIFTFSKKETKYLHIETTEISCTLHYTYEQDRDEDYEKLKEFAKEAE